MNRGIGLAAGFALIPGLGLAQAPAAPPPPLPLSPSHYPAPIAFALPNGLKVVVIETHRRPVVSVSLSLPAGGTYDPRGKEGLADLLAGLLTKGAGDRSAEGVATAVEAVGGSFSASADPDFLTIEADALSASAPLAFSLVADAARRPVLDPQDLTVLRRQAVATVQSELNDPGSVASQVFLATLYGRHPYGHRASQASIEGISRSDLELFVAARFRPANGLVVISGDITQADARRLATTAFGRWRGLAAAPLVASPTPVRTKTEIVLVHYPGASETNILLGNTTLAGSDTSYYAALVLNRVLGETENSRLARTIGVEKQWAPAAYSYLSRPLRTGMFQAGGAVRTEVADSAVRELLAQCRRLQSEPVPASELDVAKSALAGRFPLTIQTANELGTAVTRVRLFGLAPDYLTTYRQRIGAISAARVQAVARNVLKPDAMVIVVVGDGAKIYRGLAAIAPVRIVSLDGNALTPKDIEPKDVALRFDLTRLRARKDSLVVLAQGRAVGQQVATLEPHAGGVLYTEVTTIGKVINQTTRVQMDSAGHMVNLDQVGQLQGQQTSIQLAYGGGRVQGKARVATPQGPKDFQVDTTVAADIVDDNALQALLPALPLAPNVRLTLPVFASGQNRTRLLSITVTGVGQVTVPAGTFEAFRVEVSGDEQHVTFYVRTEAPYQILRVTVDGTPLEFVAVTAS